LSWWDGQVIVKNLHDCLGLELVQHDGEDASFRASVFPGGIGSPPNSEYTLEATVPADKTRPSAVYALHIAAAPRSARPNIVRSGDNPAETAQVIDLTRTQKAVGRAVVAPLLAGRGHRASFKEISQTAYFSQSAVRDAIYAMDLRFVTAGLAVPDDGDALDRVSYVLRRHSFLVR
jgi:hypothetical protein